MNRLTCSAALLALLTAACGPDAGEDADSVPAAADAAGEEAADSAGLDAPVEEIAPEPEPADFTLEVGQDWRAALEDAPLGEPVRVDLDFPAGPDHTPALTVSENAGETYTDFTCEAETLGPVMLDEGPNYVRARQGRLVVVVRPGVNERFPENSLQCVETDRGPALNVQGVYSVEIEERESVTLVRIVPAIAR